VAGSRLDVIRPFRLMSDLGDISTKLGLVPVGGLAADVPVSFE
jgi:hypothetical protein